MKEKAKNKAEELEDLIAAIYWKGTPTEAIARSVRQEERNKEAERSSLFTKLHEAVKYKVPLELNFMVRAQELADRIGLEPFKAVILFSNNPKGAMELLEIVGVNRYLLRRELDKDKYIAHIMDMDLPTMEEVLKHV